MKIQFCGAAREVTGSAHLITLDDGYTILLDCGLYQGYNKEMKTFNNNWLFKPEQLDCVVLSHAHIDHSGRLPMLYKDGFRGTIYCTHATRSLCSIMLLDSAFIQEREAEYFNKRQLKKGKKDELREPLYERQHANEVMRQFVSFNYEHWLQIHPNVRVLFRDAGHILGSASVTLEIKEKGKTIRFGFTGDVGRPERPILRDPQPMPEVDYLICESTYGDQEHEMPPAETDHFLRIIREAVVERKGKLIIPAFSIGRTQEIVYLLDQLENKGLLPKIPVYVDSPLAVNATTIYGTHPECYDKELSSYILSDPNPFGFSGLIYNRDVEVSKSLNSDPQPCIIISASGMMNAGRVKHHLANNIEQSKNTFLLVGYCAPHTPCGKLREGATELRLFGDEKTVRARVEIMDSFSAHADRTELLDFLQNQKSLKQLYLVHGPYERQLKFKDYLGKHGFDQVSIPELGDIVNI
ncbi:MAG: MBL fold metallo-hydrolase [Bacteroidota bacterium]